MSPWVPFVGALLIALIGHLVGRTLARSWRRRTARGRARRARKGELRSEDLLRELGYRIVERQPVRTMHLVVDGTSRDVELRPDLIVSKGGRVLVAEVKTGAKAPLIETRSTRRQLLEYRVACAEADGVLLVDAEEGAVHEVEFPLESIRLHRPAMFVGAMVLGIVIGVLGSWLLAFVDVR